MPFRKPRFLLFIRSKERERLYSKMTSFFKSQLCNSRPSARLLPGHSWGSWRVTASLSPCGSGRGNHCPWPIGGRAGSRVSSPVFPAETLWSGKGRRAHCLRAKALRGCYREEGRRGREPGFPSQLLPTTLWFCGNADIPDGQPGRRNGTPAVPIGQTSRWRLWTLSF